MTIRRNLLRILLGVSLVHLTSAFSVSAQQFWSKMPCRITFYRDVDLPSQPSKLDQTAVFAARPAGFPKTDSCVFIKAKFADQIYLFAVYDQTQGEYRALTIKAIQLLANGSSQVVAELSPHQVADPLLGVGRDLTMQPFPIKGRVPFVFAIGFPTIHQDFLLLFGFENNILGPIGPDWRRREAGIQPLIALWRRAPLYNPVASANSGPSPQDSRGNVIVATSTERSRNLSHYAVPKNMFHPWPLVFHAFDEGAVYLKSSDVGEDDDHRVTITPEGAVREERYYVTPILAEGLSPLLQIRYPDLNHIPATVSFRADNKEIYRKLPSQPGVDAEMRVPFGAFTDVGRLNFIVEGEEGARVTFALTEPLCDINTDGEVNQRDLDAISHHLGEASTARDFRDQNGNGAIDSADVLLCQRHCSMNDCSLLPLAHP